MKTIGLVTRTMIDEVSGEELTVVYVPTSPNSTSGFIQIMSLPKVISTNWTLDEAMRSRHHYFCEECRRPRQTCASTLLVQSRLRALG
jgi:hypothetical protein